MDKTILKSLEMDLIVRRVNGQIETRHLEWNPGLVRRMRNKLWQLFSRILVTVRL